MGTGVTVADQRPWPLRRNLFTSLALVLLLVSSGCNLAIRGVSPSKTVNELPYHWAFDATTSSNYSTASSISLAGGVCRLTPSDQTDASVAAISGAVNHTGLVWDANAGAMRIDTAAGLGNTTDLDPSWTPHYSNIIGYWKFNGSGAVANGDIIHATIGADGVASNSNGTGMSYSAGMFGTGLNMDGVDDSVLISNVGFNPTAYDTGFTMSVWIYPRTSGHIMSFDETGASGFMSIGVDGGTDTLVYTMGTATQNHYTNYPVVYSRWYHIVVTHTPTQSRAYVNGALVETSADSPFNNNISSILRFNRTQWGYGNNNAIWDEVAIYGVALTQDDVSAIYSRQSAKYSAQLKSRVMDAYSASANFTTMSWVPTLPFFKPLLDSTSESTAQYPSLANTTLMTGIKNLWHLDETAAGSVGGADLADSSVSANHMVLQGTPKFAADRFFNNAIYFDGNSTFTATSPTNLNYAAGLTVSGWFKTVQNDDGKIVSSPGTGMTSNDWAAIQTFNGNVRSCIGELTCVVGTTVVNDNRWHHLVLVTNATNSRLILDGNVATPEATFGVPTSNFSSTITIGGAQGTGFFFIGSIDEVAIWTRDLSDTEIQQLYRRGANRLRFQVRTCTASDCSDDPSEANWKGPDGTRSTYFSELNNRSVQSASLAGVALATRPSMAFSNFTSPIGSARYFQYRAVFESDDQGAQCNYGSGAVNCSPELKSLTVDPVHYDSSNPSVTGIVGPKFGSISALTQTLGANGCSSGVSYVFSIDKVLWYYWNGSTWTVANGTVTQSNSSVSASAQLSSFATQVGAGTLYFKAFLKSSGTSACELDDLLVQ